MSEDMKALVGKMVAVSNLIHERTIRNKANYLHVQVGSPLYEAIQRGEFKWMGIEPDTGVPIEHDGWVEYGTE